MKKLIITQLIVLLFCMQLFSQNDTIVKPDRFKADFGVGYGIAYAGFMGAKLQYSPIKNFAIFGSGGFFAITLGWQLGVIGYIIPKTKSKPVRVYCTAMYGTIAAVEKGYKVNNLSYHGTTLGAGLEVRFGKPRKHGFNFDILFPIIPENFKEDVDNFFTQWYTYSFIELRGRKNPSPVTISIGYHFEM
ncbi:MAG: hypothetical protein HQ521_12790 [Bacteroidetes bacterium]|nr:hypothetical protein [Bacteroidota bacterium]